MTRLAALSLLALAGCAPGVRIDRAALERAAPATVAVVPFTLEDDDDLDGARARVQLEAIEAAVAGRVATLSWLVLTPVEVDRRLRLAGLSHARAQRASYQLLARALGVDALVRGRIDELSNLEGGILYTQTIKGEVRLLDAKSGDVLASVHHEERSLGGLLPESTQAVRAIRDTLDNSSDIGFVRLCDRFAEKVVRDLPGPPKPPTVTQPHIESVEVQAPERPLVEGDRVEIVAHADGGLFVTASLGDGPGRLPLLEEAPGVYRSTWIVARGVKAGGQVKVRAADPFGQGALLTSKGRALEIDTRPPAPPGDPTAACDPAGVRLTWLGRSPDASPAAGGWRVFGADGRGVPTLLAVAPTATTEVVVPAGSTSYGVAAIDGHGRLSPVAWVRHEGGSR